ncbi:nuclear transport factor 2 family protein [Luteimonas sp. A649]
MRIQSVALLCTAFILTACTSTPVEPKTYPSLTAASDAYFSASRSGDTAKAASLLAEDHLFIGPTGKVQDKPTRVAWLKGNQDWLPSVSAQDVEVKQFGQTGRISGVWVIPEAGATIHERFIHVWSFQDGRWQMISHQVTEMPPPEGEGQ